MVNRFCLLYVLEPLNLAEVFHFGGYHWKWSSKIIMLRIFYPILKTCNLVISAIHCILKLMYFFKITVNKKETEKYSINTISKFNDLRKNIYFAKPTNFSDIHYKAWNCLSKKSKCLSIPSKTKGTESSLMK